MTYDVWGFLQNNLGIGVAGIQWELIDKTRLALNWSLLNLVDGYTEVHSIILSTFVFV